MLVVRGIKAFYNYESHTHVRPCPSTVIIRLKVNNVVVAFGNKDLRFVIFNSLKETAATGTIVVKRTRPITASQ